MKKWSKFIQNAEFLEKTRMYTLSDDTLPMIADKTGLTSGMKVLDVGCGSGEYVYYLSKGVSNVEFTGIDYDGDFIDTANMIKDKRLSNGNKAVFIQADAAKMPFESGSFDLVVSHTFFNSAPCYLDALNEMKRVVKYGGKISAVAAMDYTQMAGSEGVYPKELSWKKRYDELFYKVHEMFEKTVPMGEYMQGISTKYLPYIFSKAGLMNVSVYPFGNFMSTSNAAMPRQDKEKYIRLDHEAEMKRLSAIYELDQAKDLLTEDEVNEYRSLSLKKRDYLLANIGENTIWEWTGFADLLVVGEKPSEDETIMSLFKI